MRAQSVRRRICQRGAVLDGWVRMPAMPVAQMPRAGQAGLARMAMLAVELACKADARLVLIRQSAHRRDVPRRGRIPRRTPIRRETARKTAIFGGFWAKMGGLGRPKKPPGVGSPLRIKALGRPEGVGGYGRRSGTVRCPLFATKTAKKRTVGGCAGNDMTGDETCRL